MKLKTKLYKKSVAFIPIYSMRSYETGLYDLTCDGNFARVMNLIKKSKCKARIYIPPRTKLTGNTNEMLDQLNLDKNIFFYEFPLYRENAGATRNLQHLDFHCVRMPRLEHYDYVVVEPNFCVKYYLDIAQKHGKLEFAKKKLIYWCPVSYMGEYASFLKGFLEIDRWNSFQVHTFVCTPAQVHYLSEQKLVNAGMSKISVASKKLHIDDDVYDNNSKLDNVLFFPFRATDQGYNLTYILDVLYDLYFQGYRFKMLYSDPNSTFDGILDQNYNRRHGYSSFRDCFIKVPTDKAVYHSILKSKPIIPLLEKIDHVLHQNIFEFNRFKCRVILLKGFKHKFYTRNSIKLNNIFELSEVLKHEFTKQN